MPHDEITAKLWAMPPNERIAMLLLSVVERDTSPVVAATSVIALGALMSRGMSTEDRFRVALKMRNEADLLERPELVH